MGSSPASRVSILFWLLSTQITVFPVSAKQGQLNLPLEDQPLEEPGSALLSLQTFHQQLGDSGGE